MAILLIFSIGTILGSFFGLVIDRIPKYSIISPRSHCGKCGQTLIWRDLIPIISQLINRSRCRYCNVKLPYWYSTLELSCGGLFVIGWLEKVDLTFCLICLASLLMVGFDFKNHAFPLWIWLIFFLLLNFTTPCNPCVFSCLIIAILTEISDLKIGSGDWLYLSLLSFSADFFHLTLCLLLASLGGLLYYALNPQQKKAEIPFLPFLFISYLCTVFIFN
ncbi:prepilin peptidase [Pseudolactococcus yaeyamensis]